MLMLFNALAMVDAENATRWDEREAQDAMQPRDQGRIEWGRNTTKPTH